MVEPGDQGKVADRLSPGTYAIICLRLFEQVGEPRPFGLVGPVHVE